MDMYALAGLGPGGKDSASAPAANNKNASSSSKPKSSSSATSSSTTSSGSGWGPPANTPAPAGGATRFVPPNLSAAKKAAAAKSKPIIQPHHIAAIATGGGAVGTNAWFKDVKNLYDPAHPNDYDEWMREVEAGKKAKELEAALAAKQAEASRKLASLTAGVDAAAAAAASAPAMAPPSAAMVPPPPPSVGRGRGRGVIQPAWKAAEDAKRQRISPLVQPSAPPPGVGMPPPTMLEPHASAAAADSSSSSSADADADPGLSMLKSMGWSEGQGLGKEGQGMRTPLVAKKTDSATGVIVNADDRFAPPPPPPGPSGPPGGAAAAGGGAKAVTFRGRPSRVLLLKNMVGPGEVDEELENEIGEECTKFGEVHKVRVVELPPGPTTPEEEAVRIFVQFAKQAAAMKAYIDLDGRYFGGREVKVAFFAEADFEATM